MPMQEATLCFTDEAEAERFNRLRPDDAAGPQYLEAGARAAREIVVPAIESGQFGHTAKTIDGGIRYTLRGAMKGLRECSDDERFLYRLGYGAVAQPARDAALTALGVGAGLALAAIALPSAPAPSHALAMPSTPRARRPLQPEDFGALLTK